jgi:hypothetical protein
MKSLVKCEQKQNEDVTLCYLEMNNTDECWALTIFVFNLD